MANRHPSYAHPSFFPGACDAPFHLAQSTCFALARPIWVTSEISVTKFFMQTPQDMNSAIVAVELLAGARNIWFVAKSQDSDSWDFALFKPDAESLRMNANRSGFAIARIKSFPESLFFFFFFWISLDIPDTAFQNNNETQAKLYSTFINIQKQLDLHDFTT